MDCRAFRNQHVAYVDDFLPGEAVVAMQRHLLECERCAAHDAKIRRSLLLFRNLPPVETSPDFYSRLSARIESERAAPKQPMFAARGPGIGMFMGVAASVVTVGYLAAASLHWTAPRGDVVLAPVVATEPAVVADVAPRTDTSFHRPAGPRTRRAMGRSLLRPAGHNLGDA